MRVNVSCTSRKHPNTFIDDVDEVTLYWNGDKYTSQETDDSTHSITRYFVNIESLESLVQQCPRSVIISTDDDYEEVEETEFSVEIYDDYRE